MLFQTNNNFHKKGARCSKQYANHRTLDFSFSKSEIQSVLSWPRDSLTVHNLIYWSLSKSFEAYSSQDVNNYKPDSGKRDALSKPTSMVLLTVVAMAFVSGLHDAFLPPDEALTHGCVIIFGRFFNRSGPR